MADIELVIKIDEDIYKTRKRKVNNPKRMIDEVDIAIANGTPLPKGHGRLIDADALDRRNVNCANVPMNFIDVAPTIIKADKEN